MANIDQYEKLRLIGNGSFASIWKVRHKELGYIRAIKESKELVTDEHDKAYRTFLKECGVLLRLGNGGHPNIVRIYEPRLVDNRAIVEMDYVQGETLNAYLARVKYLPSAQVVRFMREIVGALAYCHVDIYKYLMNPVEDELEPDPDDATRYLVTPEKERELVAKYGVVHNDLHSNNIMHRDVDGGFVLLDFGLSVQNGKAVKSSARNDGALEYLAPEKWEPTRFEQGIGPWTDVYSLGILLYEVLAGSVPFPLDPNEMAGEQARHRLYTQHMEETPPAIEPLRRAAFEATHPGETWEKDYPQWLENVVMRCLAKQPEERYANAREVLDEIEKNLSQAAHGPMTVLNVKLEQLRDAGEQMAHDLEESRKDAAALSQRLAATEEDRSRLSAALEVAQKTTPSTALKAAARSMNTASTLLLVATLIVAVITWLCDTFTHHDAATVGCWVIGAWSIASILTGIMGRVHMEQILTGRRLVPWSSLVISTALVVAGMVALLYDPRSQGVISLVGNEWLAYVLIALTCMLALAAVVLVFITLLRRGSQSNHVAAI